MFGGIKQMKQMTKQELIELIKDKQANARQMFENLLYADNATEKTNELQRANLVGEQKMAIDIIAFLESIEIVNDTLCPTCIYNKQCNRQALVNEKMGKDVVSCADYNQLTKANENVGEEVERNNKEDDKKPMPSIEPIPNFFADLFSKREPQLRYMFEVRRIFIEPEKIDDGLVFSELKQIVCTEDEVQEYMREQKEKTNTYCVQIKSKKEIY